MYILKLLFLLHISTQRIDLEALLVNTNINSNIEKYGTNKNSHLVLVC